MTETIRVWRRTELEEAAALEPETTSMIKINASARFLLAVIEYAEQKGGRIEMLSLYGDPNSAEIRFFRRDVP